MNTEHARQFRALTITPLDVYALSYVLLTKKLL